jgi:hypothetical protein
VERTGFEPVTSALSKQRSKPAELTFLCGKNKRFLISLICGATFRRLICLYYRMPSYQVTIQFEMNDEFMDRVPAHRTYINFLINKGIVDHYAVSMETQRVWITLSAKDKEEVEIVLKKSPLFKFWTFEIDELFVLDGQHYRLPEVNPN